MATKTFKVALSLDNPRIIQSGIDVRSFDKQSIKIAIELTKNSQTYQIPTGAQIKISLLKIARQEQKIILDVPFTSAEAIEWLVPDYLDGYQGEVRVGVYLIVGTENIDVGYFNITSKVSDIDKASAEFTDSVMQGWDQIEADLAEIRDMSTQFEALASDVTSKYNAFDSSVTQANQTIDEILALQPQFQSVLDETTGKDVISAPEIIVARGGAQTLGERLDSDKDEVTAQLAQKANQYMVDVRDSRFGVIGDGIADDYQAIQNAIDYAYTNKIYSVYFPNGKYAISKPLISKNFIDVANGDEWWFATGVKFYGQDVSKTHLFKTGDGVLDGINTELDNVDSTLIIYTQERDGTTNNGGQGTGFEIHNMRVENKSTNPDGLVITGKSVQRSIHDRLNIVNKKGKGIYYPVCYSSKFTNIVYSVREQALYIGSGTSNVTDFQYAPDCLNPFRVHCSYSTINGLSADNSTGTIYNISGRGSTFNLGCESPKAKYIIESTGFIGCHVNSLAMDRQTGDPDNGLVIEDCAVIKSNGQITVDNLGIAEHKEIVGNSYLLENFGSNLQALNIGQIVYLKQYTGVENPKLLYSKSKSTQANSIGKLNILGSNVNVRRNLFMPFVGLRKPDESLITGMQPQAIYLGNKTAARLSDNTDIGYEQSYNVGDVVLTTDPTQNRLGYYATQKNGEFILNNVFKEIPINLRGTTVERPSENLYVGMMYFDTTLGKPIWCKFISGIWVDATGATV